MIKTMILNIGTIKGENNMAVEKNNIQLTNELEKLNKNVALLLRRVMMLEKQNSILKNQIHQQKLDISALSR